MPQAATVQGDSWLPSRAPVCECLQPQKQTVSVLSASNIVGENPEPLREPSQNGRFLLRKHELQAQDLPASTLPG